jgi:hypothetical protein
MTAMSTKKWTVTGIAMLVAVSLAGSILAATGALATALQVLQLLISLGIPSLAARREGTVWSGALTGALMTGGAGIVVLGWSATGLPPYARVDLELSSALLVLVVALLVISLVGLALGAVGGLIGRALYLRTRWSTQS